MLADNIKELYLAGEKYIPESKLDEAFKYFGQEVTYNKLVTFFARPNGLQVNPSAIIVNDQFLTDPDKYSPQGSMITDSSEIFSVAYTGGEIYLGFETLTEQTRLAHEWYDYHFVYYRMFSESNISETDRTLLFAKLSDKNLTIGGVDSLLSHLARLLLSMEVATC